MTTKFPRHARRTLRALVLLACPPDCEELCIREDIVDHADGMLASMPWFARTALIAGLAAYELGAILWPRCPGRRASSLSPRHAQDYFAAWWNSRLGPQRTFAHAVKGLLCMAYYEMPAVKERLNYQPERWVQKVRRQRLLEHGAAIQLAQRQVIEPDPLPLEHRPV